MTFASSSSPSVRPRKTWPYQMRASRMVTTRGERGGRLSKNPGGARIMPKIGESDRFGIVMEISFSGERSVSLDYGVVLLVGYNNAVRSV